MFGVFGVLFGELTIWRNLLIGIRWISRMPVKPPYPSKVLLCVHRIPVKINITFNKEISRMEVKNKK